MKIKGEDWLKFSNKRMNDINVLDEIECSKMLRDIINRYFAVGKKDIFGISEGIEKPHETVPNKNTDKYIQGWNVGYYMQSTKWDSEKK